MSSDEQYGREYYENHCGSIRYDRSEPHWLKFFGDIADNLIRLLQPRRVLDIGCAKGFLVESLRDRGVEAWGIDVSQHAIAVVRPDLAPYCRIGKLSDPITETYDLITCIEVAEHVPQEEMEIGIGNMTAHADTILFSSTPDDFTEPTHVNVRPMLHWLRMFAQCSFAPDLALDAGFVAPQAFFVRRSPQPPSEDLLASFAECHRLKLELAAQTAASAELRRNLEHVQQELRTRDVTLQAVLTSRGWRLLNRLRDLRNLLSSLSLLPSPIRKVDGTGSARAQYRRWIAEFEKVVDADTARRMIAGFQYRPTISIVVPVYNPPREYLEKAIASVRRQYYQQWELCLCDDGSSAPHVREMLEAAAAEDGRIKIVFSPGNEGISAASNRALAVCTGEYVGLLDHDDELTAGALLEIVNLLQSHRDADVIYTDEDKLEPDGTRSEPFFKPDWSPELLLSCMYTCHFSVYRKALVDEVGGLRPEYDGSQDYDLVLRIAERTDKIHHLPKVLYRWRRVPGSTASRTDFKTFAITAGRKALCDRARRLRIEGEVLDGHFPGRYRVRPRVSGEDMVSVIIPTKDKCKLLQACIESIEHRTDYPSYEIIIVDNGSVEARTLEYFERSKHRVLPFREKFNYSRINNFGAQHARGRYLLLLNNDTEVITREWMTAMVEYAQQEPVGVVGAKLLYRNGTIQHAGVVLGLGGVAGHAFSRFPDGTSQYFGTANCIRNYSAVTGACMMVRKDVFDQVGGFDEQLAIAFNDVDFCLRVRNRGLRIVWTPYAKLYHYESASRGFSLDPREIEFMQQRWGEALLRDPFYNPNLTFSRADFSPRP